MGTLVFFLSFCFKMIAYLCLRLSYAKSFTNVFPKPANPSINFLLQTQKPAEPPFRYLKHKPCSPILSNSAHRKKLLISAQICVLRHHFLGSFVLFASRKRRYHVIKKSWESFWALKRSGALCLCLIGSIPGKFARTYG